MKHMEFLDLNQQIKWKLQQNFVNKADQMRKKISGIEDTVKVLLHSDSNKGNVIRQLQFMTKRPNLRICDVEEEAKLQHKAIETYSMDYCRSLLISGKDAIVSA